MFDPSCLFQMLNWVKKDRLRFNIEVSFDKLGFSIAFSNVFKDECIKIEHIDVQSGEEMVNSLSKMQMAVGGLCSDFECEKSIIHAIPTEDNENITINAWNCTNELRVVKMDKLPSGFFPRGKTFIQQNFVKTE